MDIEGLKPFLEALQDLQDDKDPTFLGKKVEGAVLVLTVRDGDALRGAIVTINAGLTDLTVALESIIELGVGECLCEHEVPCGTGIN